MQNYNLKLKIIFISLLTLTFNFALLTFNLPKVFAQQSISLAIYPPLLEVMIKPGKSITQVYKIYNQSPTDQILTAKIVPFEPTDETGGIKLIESDQQYEISNKQDLNSSDLSPISYHLSSSSPDWFSLQNADIVINEPFLVKANSQRDIVLKIKIPQTAKEIDYYQTFLFETQTANSQNGQSLSQVQSRIGANILLTVSESGLPELKASIGIFEPENYLLRLPFFKTATYLIDSFDQPGLNLAIKNTGNSLFKPFGRLSINGWLNSNWNYNLYSENILSGSQRKIYCSQIIDNQEEINTNPESAIKCKIDSHFLIGSTKTKIEFGLNKAGTDNQAEIRLLALPVKLILGIITIVIFIMTINGFKNSSLIKVLK